MNNVQANYVQLEILKELLFNPTLPFSELDQRGIGSNLIAYHLKKLLRSGFVEKSDSLYSLTAKGKEFASMIDTWQRDATIHKQGKNRAVLFIFQNKVGKSKVVVQQRLKEPFYGCKGFPSEKIQFGEKVSTAVVRCLKRETGLKGEPLFGGMIHKLLERDGKIIEDSYFYCFTVSRAKGNLKKEGQGLKNEWMNPSDYLEVDRSYPGTFEVFKKICSGKRNFWIEDCYDAGEF